jgi:NADPH:quinone reductase-like Zn-dependent oxidoreductase
MRAVQYSRFGGSEVLQVVGLPDPTASESQVLVAMGAATVMPADWKLRSGLLQKWIAVTLPKIPGRGGAGVVEAVGPKVAGLRPGDSVLVSVPHSAQGTQATLIACDADHLAKIPASVPLEQGAAIVRSGIAAWAGIVATAHVVPDMRVLVHGGAGGVGSLAVQIACNLGAVVTATCAHQDRDYVAGLGASTVIAYDREDFSRRPDRYDIVLDTVGGEVFLKSLSTLNGDGRLVYLIAAPIPEIETDRAFPINVEMAELDGILTALAEGLATGRLRPSVTAVMGMDEVRTAYDLVERRSNRRGHVVVAIH